jgi:hypothetical protein
VKHQQCSVFTLLLRAIPALAEIAERLHRLLQETATILDPQ